MLLLYPVIQEIVIVQTNKFVIQNNNFSVSKAFYNWKKLLKFLSIVIHPVYNLYMRLWPNLIFSSAAIELKYLRRFISQTEKGTKKTRLRINQETQYASKKKQCVVNNSSIFHKYLRIYRDFFEAIRVRRLLRSGRGHYTAKNCGINYY